MSIDASRQTAVLCRILAGFDSCRLKSSYEHSKHRNLPVDIAFWLGYW